MLSSFYGKIVLPSELARKKELFTKDGLIIWSQLGFLESFQYVKRVYGYSHEEIKASLSDPDGAVILQLQGYHWVVALPGKATKGKYRIADPWLGDKTDTSRYKDLITGSAHFIRKK